MKAKLATLAIVVLVASATLGAMAYTTGSVSRSVSADVVTDDTGLISLQAGQNGLVYQKDSGALTVDFTNKATAGGVNVDAKFEIGDTSNANTSYAFNMTNLDAESHDFTFDYSGTANATADAGADADANIQFKVYDASGTEVDMASEEAATGLVPIGAGETRYVVVVVDTHGLDSTADLSGTLKISA